MPWKHVWSNFCLWCVKLLDDNAVLLDVRIRNNSQLTFQARIQNISCNNEKFLDDNVALMVVRIQNNSQVLIKKKGKAMEQASMGHRHISGKHVWSNFCLSCIKDKLLNDDAVLQDVRIRKNSQFTFNVISDEEGSPLEDSIWGQWPEQNSDLLDG